MTLILFCHPGFQKSQSMARFARMLQTSFEARGHAVQIWSPRAKVIDWIPIKKLRKWGGYIDQFLIFPYWVRRALNAAPKEALYVLCDQALGPWIPLIKNRPHVVHVHDLLALRSALGCIPENPTSLTGRIYQRYIRRGFRQARHFISISEKTREDLHRYGRIAPTTSEVVYNGLSYAFQPMTQEESLRILRDAGLPATPTGMLLHVGGGQWYKNTFGLLRLYVRYVEETRTPLPLWCIGPHPDSALVAVLEEVPSNGKVLFLQDLSDRALQAAYSLARAMIFPSLEEGFGWPIIEAQACGCPVVTTNAAPMNEIAGEVATLLPRLSFGDDVNEWARFSASRLSQLLARDSVQQSDAADRGIIWARRFESECAIDAYLSIYERILKQFHGHASHDASPL